MASSFERDAARLSAGTVAPRSGLYRVYHHAHRMPHTVIILEGDLLPPCGQCGYYVQFSPMAPAEPITWDSDFKQHGEATAAS